MADWFVCKEASSESIAPHIITLFTLVGYFFLRIQKLIIISQLAFE